MKAVILAGGLGSRLSEETRLKPKPMVEVGDRPILWHIMKIFSHHGIRDFVVCLGYRGYFIKEYFANYQLHNSDVTFDYRDGQLKIHQHTVEPWSITLVDTGLHTMTGGRLKRIRDYVSDGPFLMTYGDGVGDVDIRNLVEFHKSHDSAATVTAVRPPGRFGRLAIDDDARVDSFAEKPVWDGGFINGGFFVLEPEFSIASKETSRSGNASRWRVSHAMVNFGRSCTMGSGSRWTRCGTNNSLTSCGRTVGPPGRSGMMWRQPRRRRSRGWAR